MALAVRRGALAAARPSWLRQRLPSWSRLSSSQEHPLSGRALPTSSALGWHGSAALLGGFVGAVGLGSGTTTRCSSAEEATDIDAVVRRLEVVPFGVLGTQLLKDKSTKQTGSKPGETTVIVDSGGHWVVRPGGPRRAGGAATSIYKWIGISCEDHFEPDVVAGLHGAGEAKYHNYGEGRHVIHAFGPDLRKMPDAEEEAVEALASTYESILREFAESGVEELRLLPISGGLFAGAYGPAMPALMARSLRKAIERLPEFAGTCMLPSWLLSGRRRIQICIFMEAETEAFEVALRGRSQ